MWITFTLTRLDRLHARVDAAQAALDAQLVRRAAALQHVAEAADSGLVPARRSALARIAASPIGAAIATGSPGPRWPAGPRPSGRTSRTRSAGPYSDSPRRNRRLPSP